MFTQFFTHSACLEHDTGDHHPECADRLRAIYQALEHERFVHLERHEAPLGDIELVRKVHKPEYVDAIMRRVPKEGQAFVDGDTVMSPMSGEAMLRSVGGVCAAIDSVMTGMAPNAFVATRPPGHHAEFSAAMGFCFFNNAACGARYARDEYNIRRVAVIDFDVHHGNGTEELFRFDPDLFYGSSHQFPAYPGTGHEADRGQYNNICNAELKPGATGQDFRHVYDYAILPALDHFKPELLIISAGFDAHARDPLAQLRLQTDDFAWVTRELKKIAHRHCRGRIVSVLEGGYDLGALAASVAVHIAVLMEH
ncbi:MAG: histone deacetylase family protein [Rhodospirillales bacterium]